uniref:Uncharacterized protein n=1 Tax=Candidatus Kentrum sp. LPFa TaxID=2126335 RepID=A0A450W8C2_9GAMM|nr:MAG: hypothetical protein BECKLPF1236A_GA0070988_100855 [Candidatus Kentron sp. LPFa]VFK24283.1 MAG: hypothetical protein BECKLPF1236C_GA0070990_100126 [Candidatus Kentron sp. LPFa]
MANGNANGATTSAGETSLLWILGFIAAFAALVAVGVMLPPEHSIASLIFLSLSVVIGIAVFVTVSKDKKILPAIITAVATIAVVVILIQREWTPDPPPPPQTHPHRLLPSLIGAPDPLKKRFVGRNKEFAELDRAWEGVISGKSPHPTLGIIAWGGFGKTALARQWLWRRGFDESAPKPDAPDALFWRAFGEGQGADGFAMDLIGYFSGQPEREGLTDAQRIAKLRAAMDGRRYLLVLDGLGTEQEKTRGDRLGMLAAPFLRDLLREHTAGRLGRGLVLVTSRLPLADLSRQNAYQEINLEQRPLNDDEAALLLKLEGVRDASAAERQELIRAAGHHPLALKTMANILRQHNGGRAAGWWEFDSDAFGVPEGREKERHLWRILAWTNRLLDAREQRVMITIAHFREPARAQWLYPLLAPDATPQARPESTPKSGAVPVYRPEELRLPGPEMPKQAVREALDALTGLRLLRQDKEGGYAMHDLAREHFRRRFRRFGWSRGTETHAETDEGRAANTRALHARLYRLHSAVIQPVWRPEGMDGLHPLYEAVYHGARAGLHQETLVDIYRDRILRGTGSGGFYSIRKLGAIGADLAAVENFFVQPWREPSPNLSDADQAWLLNQAAMHLRALGRLTEALAPMRAGLEMDVEREEWKGAAISASNLSELELTLGAVAGAVADGARSVTHADKSGDAFWRMGSRATHGDALHQAGAREEARALFVEAETLQAKDQSQHPQLYSLQGFQYADLLLSGVERAAWRGWLARTVVVNRSAHPPISRPVGWISEAHPPTWKQPNGGIRAAIPSDIGDDLDTLAECEAVAARAEQTLGWAKRGNLSLLTIALDRLTLARAGLYRGLLATGEGAQDAPSPPVSPAAVDRANAAVEGLREAGQLDHLPRGLLTRAWARMASGDRAGARADLGKAWEIAEGGPMPLFQADILLARARLFGREADYPGGSARGDLEKARQLIGKHGYHRRDGEMADAEAVLGEHDAPRGQM